MAMIARRPEWTSWQNTTCSWPVWLAAAGAVGEGAGTPWGWPGTLPEGRLANMFVTEAPAVVTELVGGTAVGGAAARRSADTDHFSEEVPAVEAWYQAGPWPPGCLRQAAVRGHAPRAVRPPAVQGRSGNGSTR